MPIIYEYFKLGLFKIYSNGAKWAEFWCANRLKVACSPANPIYLLVLLMITLQHIFIFYIWI